MGDRGRTKRKIHDDVIRSYARKLENKGRDVVTNPGSEKNENWSGEYIDVIAKNKKGDKAILIEVETSDSVTDHEAKNQWKDYNKAYNKIWHLAVPKSEVSEAEKLVKKHNLDNCKIIVWEHTGGAVNFGYIPG